MMSRRDTAACIMRPSVDRTLHCNTCSCIGKRLSVLSWESGSSVRGCWTTFFFESQRAFWYLTNFNEMRGGVAMDTFELLFFVPGDLVVSPGLS
jgi:hypothetical protein